MEINRLKTLRENTKSFKMMSKQRQHTDITIMNLTTLLSNPYYHLPFHISNIIQIIFGNEGIFKIKCPWHLTTNIFVMGIFFDFRFWETNSKISIIFYELFVQTFSIYYFPFNLFTNIFEIIYDFRDFQWFGRLLANLA